MSAAEQEVTEAIAEAEQPTVEPVAAPHDFDIEAASDSIAADLFPTREKKDDEPDNGEANEKVAEEGEKEAGAEPEKPEEAEKQEEVEKTPAPQSWAKDTHELWDSMTKGQQDQVILRETQMKEGVDVRKQDAELGMKARDAFAPFENVLKQNNIDPIAASQKMMANHIRLASAPMEERKQLFNQLAKNYGITNEPVDEETSKITQNPFVKNLMNEVNQLKQDVNASKNASRQEAEVRISSEVSDFASKHDHFDDLSDEVARLIRADYSLDDAYKIAYRASPYFEKDLEKQREEKQKEAEKAKKLEAEKAKKAKSVNVRGRDTGKAPTAPKGTMEDTMRETMREIKNRN